ncbi:DUF5819 family protein [Streptomyces hoynatensis]|uniref:DUF5819 family protein n=1 Tax=Streptomyces hoynatensis TaxID=1141874 RepID=UPI001880AB3E|nr:DUF5819 family protein [Streptomyces hoynatensis]
MLPSDSAADTPPKDAEERGAAPPSLADTPTESVALRAISLPSRLLIGVVLCALGLYAVFHLAMVFLVLAPSNTLSEDNHELIHDYIYPEFEQNWKLFAPNPLQSNVAVQARAEVRNEEGTRVTEWYDLTQLDIDHIRHNPLPSHTAQNILRRGWDFFRGAHDDEGNPVGLRGKLSERYVHRIVLERLAGVLDLDTVQRVQFREATTRVAAPEWRPEDFDTSTTYQEFDWWPVGSQDLPEEYRR